MSLLEEVIYDERFEALDEDTRIKAVEEVRADAVKTYNLSGDKLKQFNEGFNKKVIGYSTDMGYIQPPEAPQDLTTPTSLPQHIQRAGEGLGQITDTPQYDDVSLVPTMGEVPNLDMETAMQNKLASDKYWEDRKRTQEFEAQDKPLEMPFVSPEMAGLGLVRAGQGVATKLAGQALKQPGMIDTGAKMATTGKGFALGSVAGDVGALGAIETAKDLTEGDFQREYPTLTALIQLTAGLGGGITGGVMAENRYLKRHGKLLNAVKTGQIDPARAEDFIKNDKEFVDEYLKKTKPAKFTESDEFVPSPVVDDVVAPTLEESQAQARATTRPIPARAQEIKDASVVPIGGSEDETAQAVNNLFKKKPKTQEDQLKALSKDDIAELNRADDAPVDDFGEPVVWSKGGDNLLAGTATGVEVDDEGNVNIDPEKFILGLGGYTVAKQILKNPRVQREAKEHIMRSLSRLEDSKYGGAVTGMQKAVDDTGIKGTKASTGVKSVPRPPRTKVAISENNDYINLSKIEVDEGVRGQGRAKAYMMDLVKYAESTGKPIALSPSGDFGAKVGRLKKFYKDLGFVENKGKNKDFGTQESFIYRPKAKEPVKPVKPVTPEAKQIIDQEAEVIKRDENFNTWFKDSKVVDDAGEPLTVYHGTTHDFSEFKEMPTSEIGNHHGKGFYFSDSVEDINRNYGTTEGADLTNKIEQLAEGTVDDIMEELSIDDWDEAYEIAKQRASKKVSGGTPNVMPVYLDFKNPVEISDTNPTWFDMNMMDDAGEYLDEAEGSGADLLDSLRNKIDEYGGESDEIMGKLYDELGYDSFNAKQFEDSLRGIEEFGYIDDDLGNLANHQIIREVYEDVGFDGIIFKNAEDQFKNMGMNPDTTHYVAFKPNQIKSVYNKGTFSKTDSNVLYAQGGGLALGVEEDEDGNLGFNAMKGLAGVVGTYGAVKLTEKLHEAFKSGALKPDDINILQPESKLRLAQRVLQDKFNRVKTLINTKADINTIDDALNIYQKEELYHGRVANEIQKLLTETASPIYKKIHSSGLNLDEVDEYLHARHAMERNKRMFELNGIENGSGMSDAKAIETLRKYAGNKNVEGIADMVYDMNRNRLKLIKDEGLESDEFIKQLEEGYDNYVPLKRVFEEGATFTGGKGKGFDIKGKEFKRAKGSQREVSSPLNNAILDYQETIVRAEKNRVGKSMLDFMEKFPDKDIYEVAGVKHLPQYDSTGQLLSYNPKYQLADNVLHVKVNGKVKEITIHDPALASAMKNLGAEKMGALMGYAHKAIRFLAGVSTQYNPAFTISNFQRDVQTAFFNMPEGIKANRANIFKDVGSAMRGIYRSERGKSANKWSKIYEEMREQGGTTGWLEQFEPDSLKTKIEKLAGTLEGGTLSPKKMFHATFDLIDNANTSVENSARVVAYKMAVDSGLSKAKSASIAKNLTVNFNRKGEWGSTLNTAFMFFNASIQGSKRMVEQLVKSPTTQKLVTGLMASSVGLYYYNISQNKDAYEKIPDYVKDTNYVFMREDGTYYTIKVPYGFNIFKSMGDMIAETSNGDMEARKLPTRLITTAVNAFSPIGTAPTLTQSVSPTLTRPMVDLELNKNFIGARIAPESNPYAPKDRPDSHTAFKSVNPTLKKMAVKLNEATGGTRHESGLIDVSPESMEYLLEFATGGLGKLLNRSYTATVKTIKGEEVETHKIPFLRQFYHEPREKQSLYKARDLFQESGTQTLSKRERGNFDKWTKEALKNKDIDPRKAFSMLRDFKSNQALLDFTSKHNIQSYEQVKGNKALLGEAVRSGIKESQIKKFLLKD